MQHEAFSTDATQTQHEETIAFSSMQTKGGQYWLVETECGKIWFGFMTDRGAGIGKVGTCTGKN